MHPPEGCSNPDSYLRECIIAIGERPKGKFALTMNFSGLVGCDYEWFVSSYMTQDRLTEENKQFHPFGITFQISPWNVQGKVDDGEKKPYKRINAEFVGA